MLGAFFDDSGTHAGSPVVAMGGLLGTDPQWDYFAENWTALLKAPYPDKPPLSHFHLTHCRNGLGEFAGYSLAERDRLNYLFRRIFLDSDFVTLAAAVDNQAWHELVVGELAEQLGNPLEFCFFKCVESVMNTIRLRHPGEPVLFFFDEGTVDRIGPMASLIRSQKQIYPEIERIIFAPVKKVIALQGADMIAYETYLYGYEWLKQGENAVANHHFKEYLKRDLSAGLIFGRSQIEEMIGRVREVMARTTV
jgi:hypothetical protein